MKSVRIGKIGMDTAVRQISVALVSLAAVLAAQQGKAENEISYDTVTVKGRIENAVLSDDGKWFASKTTGAKIGNKEYAGWVGNTDNLNAMFSSDCLTNVAGLAFYRGKLYASLNGRTNGLLRIDVGNGQLPNFKTAKFIKFDPNGTTAMQSPYLYATTNNLYAIDENQIYFRMLGFKEEDTQNGNTNNSFSMTEHLDTVYYENLRRNRIKDIVSTKINNEFVHYILLTNGNEMASLYKANASAEYGTFKTGRISDNTPRLWYPNKNYDIFPHFDSSTSIAFHGDKLLSTNANTDQYGYMTQIFDFDFDPGYLGDSEAFVHSDTFRTSAIGSDGLNYYAEAIDEQDSNVPLNATQKYFIKGTPKAFNDWEGEKVYHNGSAKRTGEPAFKILVKGEVAQKKVIAVAPDRLYRITSDGR